jgi:hypothetical protein
MAITEVKSLAQALSKEYNAANPDLAKCGQYLSQLKVSISFRVIALQAGYTKGTHVLNALSLSTRLLGIDRLDRASVPDTRG